MEQNSKGSNAEFGNDDKRKIPSTTVELPPKPKRQIALRSEVWKHFTKNSDNKDKCKCNYCGQEFKCATASTGTSSLRNHLSRCKSFKDFLENQTQKILTKDVGSGGGENGDIIARGFSQEACRSATARMIVLDELPFSFVDNIGFKQFCSMACPRYVLPTRKTITKDILDIFMKEKASLKMMLNENKQRVSFTTDIWTSITTMSYMVITAHFIDTKWQLHRKIISFNTIPDHKGYTIAKHFEKCLIDWGIEKIFGITVDNASANDNAIKHLKSKLKYWKEDAIVLDGECMHVRCGAHILNLVVTDGLDELNESIVAIRNAVKYVRSSASGLQAFQARVEQEKIGRGSVILDCTTRWNSTFLMLSTAVKFRPAFERMAEEDKLYDAYFHEKDGGSGNKRVGPPSPHDWDNARRMVKFLNVFYDTTLTFSASTKVTSSNCYKEICNIESTLALLSINNDPLLSSMASEMKKKFDKYWDAEKINKILIVASVLDPRGKMNFVTHCFDKLYGKESIKSEELKQNVSDLLRRLYETYSVRHGKPTTSTSVNEDSCQSIVVQESGTVSSFIDFDDGEKKDIFAEYSQMCVDKGMIDIAQNDLDAYLVDKVEITKTNRLGMQFDILSWWKGNSNKYPILAEMARDILVIPVSTVASESAFSTGGRVLDQYRSSLSPNMVEALILTQNWLRSPIHSDRTENLKYWIEDNEYMDVLEEGLRKSTVEERLAD